MSLAGTKGKEQGARSKGHDNLQRKKVGVQNFEPLPFFFEEFSLSWNGYHIILFFKERSS